MVHSAARNAITLVYSSFFFLFLFLFVVCDAVHTKTVRRQQTVESKPQIKDVSLRTLTVSPMTCGRVLVNLIGRANVIR